MRTMADKGAAETDDSLPAIVREVSSLERELHDADVPKRSARPTKTGKSRPGSSAAAAAQAAPFRTICQQAAQELGSDDDLDTAASASGGGDSSGVGRLSRGELIAACKRLRLPGSGNKTALALRLQNAVSKASVTSIEVST